MSIFSKTTIWYIVSSAILISICIGCKDQEKTIVAKSVEVVMPDDFLEFYHRFHRDYKFQKEHIVFPLEGQSDTSKWQKKGWRQHKPFDQIDEYKQEFDNLNGIITDKIIQNEGRFYIVRRFAKIGDEWHLIYYHTGHNLDGFTPEN